MAPEKDNLLDQIARQTQEILTTMATKKDLEEFRAEMATKKDLENLVTKDELAEHEARILLGVSKLIVEHVDPSPDVKKELAQHGKRLDALEAGQRTKH